MSDEAINHYKEFFVGHSLNVLSWRKGPIGNAVPGFKVAEFSPGPKINMWVYCSVGASVIHYPGSALYEFLIVSPYQSERMVEMLAMLTFYHSSHNLGFGHTLPIGEPWLEDSECKNWLVSLPYLFGPDLEIMNLGGGHAHVAWLLPITDSEREFKSNNDLEALEKKFDDVALEYWDVHRSSVV